MKVRVADYIVKKLLENEISQTFMIPGGGAMHLNNAFGWNKEMNVIFNHNEQASSMCAEGYTRVKGDLAAVCVTTGPGGTNAISGVMGAWVDSIPMIVISGQVRYDQTVQSSGLNLRSIGDQEFPIIDAVKCMTKYSVLVNDAELIRYHLEKALFLAKSGRPGPSWIDVPINIQSQIIEEDDLIAYEEIEDESDVPPKVKTEDILEIINRIKKSKRPIFYAGSAIRINKAYEKYLCVIDLLGIPVVTAWNSTDAIYDDHPLYAGRPGTLGDRAGNLAVENSDLILSVGCRLSIRQVGFNHNEWAKNAYKIMVDADKNEIVKPTVSIDMPMHADLNDFLDKVLESVIMPLERKQDWIDWCKDKRGKYPVLKKEYWDKNEGYADPYCAIEAFTSKLPENSHILTGNGSACVIGGHGGIIKKGTRFMGNSGSASMGYDLPASIGASLAGDKQTIYCLTGDGSIQMNLQELQTIVHHKLPIKIVLLNNFGYHSMRQTQLKFFGEPLVGVGPDSKDLSFPDMKKISDAYGFPFRRCENNDGLNESIDWIIKQQGYSILEVMIDKAKFFTPKGSTKKLEDGSMVSAPLYDMWPFLEKEELDEIMKISKND